MTDCYIHETPYCVECIIKEILEEEQQPGDLDDQYLALLNTLYTVQDFNDTTEKIINQELEALSTFKTNLNNAKEDLKNKLETLKSTEAEKQNEHQKLMEKVEVLEKKTKYVMNEVSQDIKDQENVILTYKLLTGASFLYNTKKVKGYISKGSSVIPFLFNPSKMPKGEITEMLWKLVLDDS